MQKLDPEYIRSLFHLIDDGTLVWKKRNSECFVNEKVAKIWNTKYAGKIAGTINPNGCVQVKITIDSKKPYSYLAHHLVWVIVHGYWPSEIDHKNGIRSDNRLDNLRECTRSEQRQNIVSSGKNKYLGVSWDRNANKWAAQIRVNGKTHFLGRFKTEEEAYTVYCEAKEKLHPFNPIPRKAG